MVKKKSKKRLVKSVSKAKPMGKWKPTPLKGSFMLAAMLGFFISYYMIYPMSLNFGVTFMILFALMFIASIISMTKAPVINEKL